MKCFLSYILGLTLLFIGYINAKNINVDSNTENEDKYYLIYVNNTHGEYNIFSDSRKQKRQQSQIFIESLVDEINSLIIENKDTYQNPEKLIEIEQTSQLQKRKRNLENQKYYTYDESDFVYPISSINDSVVLYAYLSKPLSKEIENKFDSVFSVTPNKIGATIYHQNYNVEDILAETKWKNLSVRENADFHLSLISQGKYNSTFVNKYDNNYYYPASAGKDVDIIILDTSFHFNYSEFSNTNDRIVKCAGNIKDGKFSTEDIDSFCGSTELYHGEIVSATAAGLTHGVANRANVYGISFPVNENGGLTESDVLVGMQYIYENMIRPHKTVINLSLGGSHYFFEPYYKQYKALIDGINKKGGIVVAASGNSGYDLRSLGMTYMIPCEYENVICVGGIDNENSDMNAIYNVSKNSNYARLVDFYAPFQVHVEILKDNKIQEITEKGTSFSSPIVAGIVASILSENDDVEYTKESMCELLNENGKSEIVNYRYGTGILANNGKRIVYSEDGQYNGCGVHAGNLPCEEPVKTTDIVEETTETIEN